MIWKSFKEEYPYTEGDIWVRYTRDGVVYHEEVMHENKVMDLECMGVPEWRHIDAPEWLKDKDSFDKSSKSWRNKVAESEGIENL